MLLKNIRLKSLLMMLFFLLVVTTTVSPCMAEDSRIESEIEDTTPIVIPLKSALGDAEFEKAMKSGEYSYAGNLKCRLCHRDFFMGRKKDIHEHTFRKSIEKKYYDELRCLVCHTTGYGIQSGFTSIRKTSKLANVQCEGCHGPGSKHNELDAKGGFLAGTDHPEILKKMCMACHDSRWNKSFKDIDTAYKAYKNAEAKAAEK